MLGIYFLKGLIKQKPAKLLLSFLLISLIPTSLTLPNPHSSRAISLIPFIEIIAAFGFWNTIKYLRKVNFPFKKIGLIFTSLFFGLLILNLFIWFKMDNNYRVIWGGKLPPDFEKIIHYIKENQYNYEKVVFTNKINQPYIYFLFYLKYDPKKFQSIEVKREYLPDNWQIVTSFDKYEFCDINQCYSPDKNNLYVAMGDELTYLKEKKIFYNLDGSVFRIITND